MKKTQILICLLNFEFQHFFKYWRLKNFLTLFVVRMDWRGGCVFSVDAALGGMDEAGCRRMQLLAKATCRTAKWGTSVSKGLSCLF